MTQLKPIILHDANSEDGWNDEIRGRVQWRTLFSADHTPTEAMTAGVAEIMPGDQLKVHHHIPSEIYYILAGNGVVTIDGEPYAVHTGTAVFIPGNALHSLQNTGETNLRLFYVFAVNSFSDVAYIFPE